MHVTSLWAHLIAAVSAVNPGVFYSPFRLLEALGRVTKLCQMCMAAWKICWAFLC